MDVITATLTERVPTVADHCERLSLLDVLAVLDNKRAPGKMRVVTVFAVPVIDGDVVAERTMVVILAEAEIVRVCNAALHCDDAANSTWRGCDVESVERVAPVRER